MPFFHWVKHLQQFRNETSDFARLFTQLQFLFYTEIKSNDYNSSTKHKVKIVKFAFTKMFTLLYAQGGFCDGTEAAGIWVFRVFSMPLDGRTGTWVWTVLIKYLIDHYGDK